MMENNQIQRFKKYHKLSWLIGLSILGLLVSCLVITLSGYACNHLEVISTPTGFSYQCNSDNLTILGKVLMVIFCFGVPIFYYFSVMVIPNFFKCSNCNSILKKQYGFPRVFMSDAKFCMYCGNSLNK